MATTTINFRISTETKTAMESVCKELGMSMTTAFTIFANKVGREHRIPFEVSVDPFYSQENMEHLQRGISALNAHEGQSHELFENE